MAKELSQAQLYLFEENFFYSWPNLICVALDAKFVVKGRPAVSVKSANWKGIFFHLKITLKLGIVLVTFGVISKPGSSIL